MLHCVIIKPWILGLETEADYKYDGKDEKCHFEKTKVKATITGGVSIPKVLWIPPNQAFNLF